MELEDFKQLWKEYDARLNASMRLNSYVLQRTNLATVQTSLNRLSRGVVIELAFNAVALLLIGSFADDNAADIRFLIPAIVLGAYFIAITAGGIYQLVRMKKVDYDEPVIAIQTKLERLKIQRIAATKWILLTAPLLWVPLLIVALRALFGIDAYATLGPAYLLVNLLAGIAVIPLALWISKRYGTRFAGSSSLRSLANDIAGRSLVAALESLDTIRRFEEE
jgi:hypothetical protein